MSFSERAESVAKVVFFIPSAISENLKLYAILMNAILILLGIAMTVSSLFFGISLGKGWVDPLFFYLMPMLLFFSMQLKMKITYDDGRNDERWKEYFFIFLMFMLVILIPILRDEYSTDLLNFCAKLVVYFR